MVSSDDPREFWKSVANLSRWRLIAWDGFSTGTFFTMDGVAVTISCPVAQLLDTLICCLGEMSEDLTYLMQTIALSMGGTRKEKAEMKEELTKVIPLVSAHLRAFKEELPQFFQHYEAEKADDEKQELAGSA